MGRIMAACLMLLVRRDSETSRGGSEAFVNIFTIADGEEHRHAFGVKVKQYSVVACNSKGVYVVKSVQFLSVQTRIARILLEACSLRGIQALR